MTENSVNSQKTAVVLFNLGGPDHLSSVKEFLFNLFNDKAIISLPQPFRFLLAKLISSRREKKAQNIYRQIGGKSPLLDITLSQADSLQKELSSYGDFKVFVAMRYWHPMANEVAEKIKEYGPDKLILLPLYPQFSSTTTASSIKDFLANYKIEKSRVRIVCCYPVQEDFIMAHGLLIKQTIENLSAEKKSKIRILFSAHGLPMSVIKKGDPYVFQINKTAKKIVNCLANILDVSEEKIDSVVCYQSKVGPMEWTSPSLEHELKRVALDSKIPVIVPIAFVSDHSETLVELDIEYREMAESLKIHDYFRVPSLNLDKYFIKTLAQLCIEALNSKDEKIICGGSAGRICPNNFRLCPNQKPCSQKFES